MVPDQQCTGRAVVVVPPIYIGGPPTTTGRRMNTGKVNRDRDHRQRTLNREES
jgi:hypothetical protein